MYPTIKEQISSVKVELKKMRENEDYYLTENHRSLLKKIRELKYRDKIIDIIKTNTILHVTIIFQIDVSNIIRDITIKTLLKRLRCDLFGRNRNKDHLKGYVVIEKHTTGLNHYHILIKDHSILNTGSNINKNIHELIRKKANSLKVKDKYKNEYTNKSLFNEKNGVQVQDYYNENLEQYLTKALEKNPNDSSFIREMTYDGFSEGI